MQDLLSDHAVLVSLIALLHDGELGFQTLSNHVHQPACRLFLLQESYMRASFAADLEAALSKLVGEPVHESGTTIGTLHRRWLDLKAGLGAETPGMLHSLETCELAVSSAYEVALDRKDLAPALRTVLQQQSDYVHRAYKALQSLCGVSESSSCCCKQDLLLGVRRPEAVHFAQPGLLSLRQIAVRSSGYQGHGTCPIFGLSFERSWEKLRIPHLRLRAYA